MRVCNLSRLKPEYIKLPRTFIFQTKRRESLQQQETQENLSLENAEEWKFMYLLFVNQL